MKSTIYIEGMHCNSCVLLLTDVLSDIEGVKHAAVDLKAGTAVVEHDAKATLEEMRKAIEAEGYKTR